MRHTTAHDACHKCGDQVDPRSLHGLCRPHENIRREQAVNKILGR